MPIIFTMSMFFLSFTPLWICVAFLNVMSLYTDRTNPYTEIIGLILLGVGLVISTVSIWKTMRRERGQNYERFSVVTAEKDTVSTTTYLLSNALPLLAFDFTKWQSVATFLVIFGSLALLCLLHHRYDSNICMEIFGYRMYNSWLNNDFETKDGITVLIRKKALNANDKIAIRKISGELYIGYEVEEQQKEGVNAPLKQHIFDIVACHEIALYTVISLQKEKSLRAPSLTSRAVTTLGSGTGNFQENNFAYLFDYVKGMHNESYTKVMKM